MRLRITRPLTGSIDGIQLGHFQVGSVYEVSTSLGSYLLSVEAAEPVDEDRLAPVPLEPELLDEIRRRAKHPLRREATDRPRKRRR